MAAQVREISAVKDQQMKEAAEKSARSVFGKAVSILCVTKWNNEMIDRMVCKNIPKPSQAIWLNFIFIPISTAMLTSVSDGKWIVLAAKYHARQKITHNSVKTYDILTK